MVTKLSNPKSRELLGSQETDRDTLKEETDGEEYTTLYLAAAYGIRYEEFPGIEFFWGERTSQIGDKIVLEGALARIVINKFSGSEPYEMHVKPNKGLVVIEKYDEFYYCKEIVSYSDWDLTLLDIRKGLSLFFDGPEMDLRIDAREILLISEGYHKYVLGSRIGRFPDTVRVKKQTIEELVELACHIGGHITGDLHEQLPDEINQIYNTFMQLGESLRDYKLHNKSIFPGFRLHAVGTWQYDKYRLYDLDKSGKAPRKKPELFGNFDAILGALGSLRGYELEKDNENHFTLYYRGRGSDKMVLGFKRVQEEPGVAPCQKPLREVPILFLERKGENIDIKRGMGMYKDNGRHYRVEDVIYAFGCY